MRALTQTYGRPFSRNGVPFAGRTDRAIVSDLIVANDLPPNEVAPGLQAVFAALPELMLAETQLTPSVAYPGVQALLERLRTQGHLLGLLTGNLRTTAGIKLASAGIDPAQFQVGAFGDESTDRNALPPLALDRASRLAGEPVTTAVVVGDTPGDIVCALANGLRAVAVATGPFSVDQLQEYGPEALLPNFSDLAAAMHALIGCSLQ